MALKTLLLSRSGEALENLQEVYGSLNEVKAVMAAKDEEHRGCRMNVWKTNQDPYRDAPFKVVHAPRLQRKKAQGGDRGMTAHDLVIERAREIYWGREEPPRSFFEAFVLGHRAAEVDAAKECPKGKDLHAYNLGYDYAARLSVRFADSLPKKATTKRGRTPRKP